MDASMAYAWYTMYFECFPGARQPASQPGGGGGRGGGFQSLPATQPRLGAAPFSMRRSVCGGVHSYQYVHEQFWVCFLCFG